jgi:hypothetical protein
VKQLRIGINKLTPLRNKNGRDACAYRPELCVK